MSESVVWKCNVQRANAPSRQFSEGLTAGEVYGLNCSGPEVQWKSGHEGALPKLTLIAEKEAQYRIAEAKPQEFSSTVYKALAVSYKISTEPFTEGSVYLTDGSQKVTLDLSELKFQSVIPKEQQEPKPFPSFGPIGYELPGWVITSLLIAGALLLAAMIWQIYRWSRQRYVKRKLIKYIETHQTALKPADHLARELRTRKKSWKDSVSYYDETREIRRLLIDFLTREFFVPAQYLSQKKLIATLNGHFRKAEKKYLESLQQVFIEIDRAEFSKTLSQKDLEQITEMVLVVSNELSENRMKKK